MQRSILHCASLIRDRRAGQADAGITLFSQSMDGRRHDFGRYHVKFPGDRASPIVRRAAGGIHDDAPLHLATQRAGGPRTVRHLAPKPYKAYSFQEPALQLTKASTPDGPSVTLEASKPAYFVALECDAPGHSNDAAFDLLPGEPRTVHFRPDRAAHLDSAAASLIARDRFSATCR